MAVRGELAGSGHHVTGGPEAGEFGVLDSLEQRVAFLPSTHFLAEGRPPSPRGPRCGHHGGSGPVHQTHLPVL